MLRLLNRDLDLDRDRRGDVRDLPALACHRSADLAVVADYKPDGARPEVDLVATGCSVLVDGQVLVVRQIALGVGSPAPRPSGRRAPKGRGTSQESRGRRPRTGRTRPGPEGT